MKGYVVAVKCAINTVDSVVETLGPVFKNIVEESEKSFGKVKAVVALHGYMSRKYQDHPVFKQDADGQPDVVGRGVLTWAKGYLTPNLYKMLDTMKDGTYLKIEKAIITGDIVKQLGIDTTQENSPDQYMETENGTLINEENRGGGATSFREAGLDFLNSIFYGPLGLRMNRVG